MDNGETPVHPDTTGENGVPNSNLNVELPASSKHRFSRASTHSRGFTRAAVLLFLVAIVAPPPTPNTLHLRSPQSVRIESRKSHPRLKLMRDVVGYVNTNDSLINDRCKHDPPSVPDSISREGWPQRIGEGHDGRSSKPPTGLGSGVACGELEAGPNARELGQWDRVHSAVDSAAGHRPKAAAPRVIEARRPLNPPQDLQKVEPTLHKNLEHNFSTIRIFTR